MKKLFFLFITSILLNFVSFSQIVFSEDFTNFTDDWNDHPDWTIYDEDGLPAGEYIGGSGTIWVHPSWRISTSWHCAMSNSRFNPSGQADNWMILPQIQLPSNTPYIIWDAKSVSNSLGKKEDYEILISTNTTNISDFSVISTITQENFGFTQHSINLTAYAGQNVYIAFRHTSNDEYILCITNIEIGDSSPNDLELTELNIHDVCLAPSQININGKISNLSGNVINSFNINWTINDGNIYSENINSVNIEPFTGTYNFTHSVQANIDNVDLYNIKVWVSDPNGNFDGNNDNDTIYTTISGLSLIPDKNVLIEEGTGAWCGNCPAGAADIENILENNTNIFAAAIHISDAMEIDDGREVIEEYFPAFPRAAIDRVKFNDWDDVAISRNAWAGKCNIRKNTIVPADINVSSNYISETRTLTVEVTANFYTVMNKEYRLNAYVIENEIPATGDGYEQNGAGDDYIHQHVLRAMLGGSWGTENSIPEQTENNGMYSHIYNFVLPDNHDFDNIQVYGLVQRYSENSFDREIVNTEESDYSLTVNYLLNNDINLNVFPNPCNENINISAEFKQQKNIKIKIFDLTGKTVIQKDYYANQGKNLINLDINNIFAGLYFVEINVGNISYIRTISVIKK